MSVLLQFASFIQKQHCIQWITGFTLGTHTVVIFETVYDYVTKHFCMSYKCRVELVVWYKYRLFSMRVIFSRCFLFCVIVWFYIFRLLFFRPRSRKWSFWAWFLPRFPLYFFPPSRRLFLAQEFLLVGLDKFLLVKWLILPAGSARKNGLFCSKFCSDTFNFSSNFARYPNSQEKLKTMPMQNFGVANKQILWYLIVFSVCYCIFCSGQFIFFVVVVTVNMSAL